MPSTYQFLDPFTYIKPGPFISEYSDWILFSLLLVLFISAAGIGLHKRFQGNQYLKPLIISLGLLMATGTYYSIYRGWLYLNMEGFGFFGAIIVLLLIFFILFGMIRGYGMRLSNALPIAFSLFYISLWAVSPNIFDTIAQIFPLLNGILLIIFIASVIKSISAFFRYSKSPLSSATKLSRSEIHQPDEPEIEDEVNFEEKERHDIRSGTMKLSLQEIKSVDQIDRYLKKILKILKSTDVLTPDQKDQISTNLKNIGQVKIHFQEGLDRLNQHIKIYKAGDRNEINELRKRFSKVKDKKKKTEIEHEWTFERKKLEIFDFINAYSSKITVFLDTFDSLIRNAVNHIERNNPKEAINPIKTARKYLKQTGDILKKLVKYEIYILRLSETEEKELIREKKGI